MYEIKRIDLHQAVKMGCFLGFVFFGLAGIVESTFFLFLRGNVFSLFRIDGIAVFVISLTLVIVNIFFGLSIGCIVGAIGSWSYNAAVKRLGGIHLDIVHLQVIPKDMPEKAQLETVQQGRETSEAKKEAVSIQNTEQKPGRPPETFQPEKTPETSHDSQHNPTNSSAS